MKTSFFVAATFLFLTRVAYPQISDIDLAVLLMKSDEEQIKDIDQMRQEIKNNLNSYSKSEKVKEHSGYRTVYRKGKDLQLIAVNQKDHSVDKRVEWYFHNGQLIYCEQAWTDRSTNKIIDQEKFYLENEHLFAWFKNGQAINAASEDFKKTADELNAYAANLKSENQK